MKQLYPFFFFLFSSLFQIGWIQVALQVLQSNLENVSKLTLPFYKRLLTKITLKMSGTMSPEPVFILKVGSRVG